MAVLCHHTSTHHYPVSFFVMFLRHDCRQCLACYCFQLHCSKNPFLFTDCLRTVCGLSANCPNPNWANLHGFYIHVTIPYIKYSQKIHKKYHIFVDIAIPSWYNVVRLKNAPAPCHGRDNPRGANRIDVADSLGSVRILPLGRKSPNLAQGEQLKTVVDKPGTAASHANGIIPTHCAGLSDQEDRISQGKGGNPVLLWIISCVFLSVKAFLDIFHKFLPCRLTFFVYIAQYYAYRFDRGAFFLPPNHPGTHFFIHLFNGCIIF